MRFDPELIDARAGAVRDADRIFVFGTAHPTPAHVAADLFGRGIAPFVVVTGGENRSRPGLVEAEAHQTLLIEAGVPSEAIVVERASRNTLENVTFAAPLIARRCAKPRSAIAVVKWYHRRAIVTLARQMPSLECIYAADYDPSFDEGNAVTRSNWRLTAPHSVERETTSMRRLVRDGVDVLVRTRDGWVRTSARVPA